MATTYLNKTYSGSGNRQRQTISVWVKKAKNGVQQAIFSSYYTSSYYAFLRFKDDDLLQYYNHSNVELKTNRKFRDTNAWYHIVITLDTTQSTSSDRVKMYINGVQETSFATATYPSQNAEVKFADDNLHEIGRHNSSEYFDGSMSHFHFVTNTAYDTSAFGETDATTGEWKIKTSPSVTYGTNGFFILKDGNSGTDQSGQSNNYSVGGGTLTKTEDCPSNVFCTNDVLGGNSGSITIGWGNSSAYRASSGWRNVTGNIGASAGKYYAEVKINGTGTNGVLVGFVNLDKSNLQNSTDWAGEDNFSAGFYSNGGHVYYQTGTTFATLGALSNNDIVQLAMDLDNGFLYFGKNGTWLNSAVPTSGGTGTGGLALSNLSSGGTYSFITSVRSGGDVRWNYGNGYFEVTAVSSAGTNASGNGIFEYDVPANFTALSTKGLNL